MPKSRLERIETNGPWAPYRSGPRLSGPLHNPKRDERERFPVSLRPCPRESLLAPEYHSIVRSSVATCTPGILHYYQTRI